MNCDDCTYIIMDEQYNIIDRYPNHADGIIAIRSCAKPIQMLSIFELGLVDKYNLSDEDITIMSSSSLGQDIHVSKTYSLLKKTGINLDDLEIDQTAPAGKIAYKNWKRKHFELSKIYNACIGNHIAMYLVQRELTGNGSGYLDLDSPVQKRTRGYISYLFADGEDIPMITRDTCGAPNYHLRLSSVARGYRNLCIGHNSTLLDTELEKAIQMMRKAFSRNPVLLEGDGCLSTILSAVPNLFAKTGADYLLGMSIDKLGFGMAIHSNTHQWGTVARKADELLSKLGCNTDTLHYNLLNL